MITAVRSALERNERTLVQPCRSSDMLRKIHLPTLTEKQPRLTLNKDVASPCIRRHHGVGIETQGGHKLSGAVIPGPARLATLTGDQDTFTGNMDTQTGAALVNCVLGIEAQMKRIWFLPLGVAIAIGCVVLLTLHPLRPGVNHRNLQRIEKGMTEPQVEEILGGSGEDFHYKEGVRSRVWMVDQQGRGGIIVHFDTDGRVDQAFAFPSNEVPP